MSQSENAANSPYGGVSGIKFGARRGEMGVRQMNSRKFTRGTVRRALAGAAVVTGLICTFAGGAAAALDGSARETLNKISTYFNSIRTMKGEFIQFAPDGSRTEGVFHLSRPGRVRFKYKKPARVEIVADGESVAVRDLRLATQDVWPLKRTPLRFLLADNIDLSADAKVTRVSVEPDLVTVVIEEETTFGDGKLTLIFDSEKHELRQWTVTDAQGDTSVAIYNVDTGMPLNDKMFKIDYRQFLLERSGR